MTRIDNPSSARNKSPDRNISPSKLPSPQPKCVPVELHAELKGPSSITVVQKHHILDATVHRARKGETLSKEWSDSQRLWANVKTGAGGSTRVEAMGRKSVTAGVPHGAESRSSSTSYSPEVGLTQSQTNNYRQSVGRAWTNYPNSRVNVIGELKGKG